MAIAIALFRPHCRRRLRLLWLALLLAAASLPARAADAPPLHAVAAKFPPYTMDDDGRMAGPTRDLLAALAARLGRQPDFHLLPLARALATAEHQPDTLIALIARTPAREGRFRWICPVLDYDVKVFRRQTRSDVIIARIEDLKRWQVVGANSDVKTTYLMRQGVPVVVTADEDEAIRLLLHDRVDLMPGHPASMHLRLQDLGLPQDTLVPVLDLPDLTSRLYLAFGPHTGDTVVAAAMAACDALTRDGSLARLISPAMLN